MAFLFGGGYPHLCDVKREKSTRTNGKPDPGLDDVVTGLAGFAEGMTAREKQFLVNTIPQACFRWTWGLEDIRDQDRLVNFRDAQGGSIPGLTGSEFILHETLHDTTRPAGFTTIPAYQTGVLVRKVVGT